MTARTPIATSIRELADRTGVRELVAVCGELLGGAPREHHVQALRALTGHAWQPGDAVLDRRSWDDHWVRSWGARGLLHVWHDSATPSVLRGLDDEHWRPAEMCLKVATRHDVAGAGDGAARLAGHELGRVRRHAARCLSVCGDSEHADVVLGLREDSHDDVRREADRTWAALCARLDRDHRP